MAAPPRCPTCKKPITERDPKVAPFCSDRCKMADLSRWLKGEYAIAARDVDDGDGAGAPDPGED